MKQKQFETSIDFKSQKLMFLCDGISRDLEALNKEGYIVVTFILIPRGKFDRNYGWIDFCGVICNYELLLAD